MTQNQKLRNTFTQVHIVHPYICFFSFSHKEVQYFSALSKLYPTYTEKLKTLQKSVSPSTERFVKIFFNAVFFLIESKSFYS